MDSWRPYVSVSLVFPRLDIADTVVKSLPRADGELFAYTDCDSQVEITSNRATSARFNTSGARNREALSGNP